MISLLRMTERNEFIC
jgi:hypothetical protein